MAKRNPNSRSKRQRVQKSVGRVVTINAIPQGMPQLAPIPRISDPLRRVEDRRLYDPSKKSPRFIDGRPSRLKAASPQKLLARSAVTFRVPEKTVVCVRRKIRKEVLHARGVAGRRGLKKPRFNFWSKLSCRRT